MNYPMMMRRSQLQDFLREHGIGKGLMQELINSGKIEKRFLPPESNKHRSRRKTGRKALYSLAQVQRAVLDPIQGVG